MVKPEDIPERVPEMDVVKPEQEQTITELLASIKSGHGGHYPWLFAREEDDLARRDLAYKFLKARRWKLKDALQMVNNTVQFRKDHGLDNWRLFPCAFPLLGYDEKDMLLTIGSIPGAPVPLNGRPMPTEWDMCYRALQSSYVNVYHYWDKEGHPVLYDCCGKASVTGILSRLEKATPVGKGLKDVIVPYHTYMNEVQYYVIRYANAKAKAGSPLGSAPTSSPSTTNEGKAVEQKKIMGITVVLDADGMHLGMLQKRFINIVRDIFSVDQSYYPEVLHRLFVINCPSLIQTAYSFVKNALDENTRKKLIFCSKSESLEVLRRVIDDEKIPQELGGSCRCEGGCLPRYVDPEVGDGENTSTRATVEVPTENITIKAGKKLSRDVFLHAGEEISWQFALENADVNFSASFQASSPTPSAGGSDRKDSLSTAGPQTETESVLTASPESRPFLTPVSAASPESSAMSPLGVSLRSHGSPLAADASRSTAGAKAGFHGVVDSIDCTPTTDTSAKTTQKDTTRTSGNTQKTKKHADPAGERDGGAGLAEAVEIKREKLSTDTGSYTAKEDGVLHLIWDNGHSWVTGKKIQLRLFNGHVE